MTVDKFSEICNKYGLYVLHDISRNGASAFLNEESSTCLSWIARYGCVGVRVARSIYFSKNQNMFGGKGYKDIADKDLGKEIERLYTKYRNLYKEHRKAKIEEL